MASVKSKPVILDNGILATASDATAEQSRTRKGRRPTTPNVIKEHKRSIRVSMY